jgi:hypothetical protein
MLISILSTTAILAGVAGTLPQISVMLRSGSSAGQSPVGWSLAIGVNAIMAYVNLVGLHSAVLAAGNVASGLLAMVALSLVIRLAARGPASSSATVDLADLATHEFHALRADVDDEDQRRQQRRALRAAC